VTSQRTNPTIPTINDARVAAVKAATNMSPSHWAKTEENVEKSLRVEYLFGSQKTPSLNHCMLVCHGFLLRDPNNSSFCRAKLLKLVSADLHKLLTFFQHRSSMRSYLNNTCGVLSSLHVFLLVNVVIAYGLIWRMLQ